MPIATIEDFLDEEDGKLLDEFLAEESFTQSPVQEKTPKKNDIYLVREASDIPAAPAQKRVSSQPVVESGKEKTIDIDSELDEFLKAEQVQVGEVQPQIQAQEFDASLSNLPMEEIDDVELNDFLKVEAPQLVEPLPDLIDIKSLQLTEQDLPKRELIVSQAHQALYGKPKSNNPYKILKPNHLRILGVPSKYPSSDEVVTQQLYQMNPALADARERFRSETGRDIVDTVVGLKNSDFKYSPIDEYHGTYELDIALTEDIARKLNAYAKGGYDEYLKESQKIGAEYKIYTEEKNGIVARVDKELKERPWYKEFWAGLTTDTYENAVGLGRNLDYLRRAAILQATKGIDSPEYEALINEERVERAAVEEALQLAPRSEATGAGFGRALGGGIGQSWKVVTGQMFPVLVYLENLHRGNLEASREAFTAIPMIGAGGLVAGKGALASEAKGFLLGSRITNQVTTRAAQALTNVASDLLFHPDQYVSGERGIEDITTQAVMGAAFPVGNARRLAGGIGRTSLGTRPIAEINIPKSTSAVELAGQSSKIRFEQRLARTGEQVQESPQFLRGLEKKHKVAEGELDIIRDIPTDELQNIRKEYITDINNYNKKYQDKVAAPTEGEYKIEREIYDVAKRGVDVIDRTLAERAKGTTQGDVKLEWDRLALNLIDMKKSLEEKTYRAEGLGNVTENIRRAKNLEGSIKTLESVIPQEIVAFVSQHESKIREALRHGDNERLKKEFIRNQKNIPPVVKDNMAFDHVESLRMGRQRFGKFGEANKGSTQARAAADIELIKDSFKSGTSTLNLNEGLTAPIKFLAENAPRLTRIAAFYVEAGVRDFGEFVNRIRTEIDERLLDFVPEAKLQTLFGEAQKIVDTNFADPFFSGLKQNVLEKFPEGQMKADSAIALLSKLGTKDEIEWTSGLKEFLDEKIRNRERISKSELVDVIQNGQVRVEEVRLGENEILSAIEESERRLLLRKGYERTEIEEGRFQELNKRRFGGANPTKYDLKTYTAERLELEGGEEPFEILLKVPFGLPEGYRIVNNETVKSRNGEYDYKIPANQYQIVDENNHAQLAIATYSKQGAISSYMSEFKVGYQEPHWSPHENVVAHIRGNNRITTDGLNILHSEEFQSQWNQTGRKEGYKQQKAEKVKIPQTAQEFYNDYTFDVVERPRNAGGGFDITLKRIDGEEVGLTRYVDSEHGIRYAKDYLQKQYIDSLISYNHHIDEVGATTGVPKNPFMENNWKELTFKRFLRTAIEKGKDGISWTTSRQQQERYGKIIETKEIKYYKSKKGTYDIYYKQGDGQFQNIPDNRGRDLNEKQLRDLLGNEFTDKILEDTAKRVDHNDYEVVKTPARTYALMHKASKEWLSHDNVKNNGDDTPLTFNDSTQAENYLLGVDIDSGTVVSGKDITISKGYSDYDTYFVNLAKKIGKRYGAEYKVKEIETAKKEDSQTYIANLDTAEKLFDNGELLFYIDKFEGVQELVRDKSQLESLVQNGDVYWYSTEGQKEQVHFLEITPSMRDSLRLQGFPIYGIGLDPLPTSKQKSGIRNRLVPIDELNLHRRDLLEALDAEANPTDGTVFNTGLNPDAFIRQAKLLFKGLNDFKEFSTQIVNKYGEAIRPYAEKIWEDAREFNKDEQGAISLPIPEFLRRAPQEYKEFKQIDRPERIRNFRHAVARSISTAIMNPAYREVYEGMRDIKLEMEGYSTGLIKTLHEASKIAEHRTSVAQAIFRGNAEGLVYTDAELSSGVSRTGQPLPVLSQKDIDAYRLTRSAQDAILSVRENQFLYYLYKELGSVAAGTSAHTSILNKIKGVQDHYRDLRETGYVSLQRRGRYAIYAEDNGFAVGDPQRIIYNHAKNKTEARQMIRKYKDDGFINVEMNRITPDFEFVRSVGSKLTPSQFEDLVAASGINPHDPSVIGIRDEVRKKFTSFTYQMKRDYTRGYTEDWKNLVDTMNHQAEVYTSSYYNNIARDTGLENLNNAKLKQFLISSTDTTGNIVSQTFDSRQAMRNYRNSLAAQGHTNIKTQGPDTTLFNTAKRYIEDATVPIPSTGFNRGVVTARQLVYLHQMALDASQLLIQSTQPLSMTWSHLARTEFTGLKGLEPEKIFTRAINLTGELTKERTLQGNIGQKLLVKKNISSKLDSLLDSYGFNSAEQVEFRNFYLRARDEGLIGGEFARSIAESELSVGSRLDRVGRFTSLFSRMGDTLSRTHAFAAGFLTAKKKGLTGEALYKDVATFIDITQLRYGQGENPKWARGEGAKLFYQFGSYLNQWFDTLAISVATDFKKQSGRLQFPRSTLRHLGGLGMVGGLAGMPLAGAIRTLITAIYDRDKKKDVEKALEENITRVVGNENASRALKNLALYGVSGRQGVSRRLGIQVPIFDNAADIASTSPEEIIGESLPAVKTVSQIGRGAIDLLDRRERIRGVEGMTPRFARNIVRTYRYSQSGARTRYSGDTSTIMAPKQPPPFGEWLNKQPDLARRYAEGNNEEKEKIQKMYAARLNRSIGWRELTETALGFQLPQVTDYYEKKRMDMLGKNFKKVKRETRRRFRNAFNN